MCSALLSLVFCEVWHCGKRLFAHKHTHTHRASMLVFAWQDAVGRSRRGRQHPPTGSSECTERAVGGLKVRRALDKLALFFLSLSLFSFSSFCDL